MSIAAGADLAGPLITTDAQTLILLSDSYHGFSQEHLTSLRNCSDLFERKGKLIPQQERKLRGMCSKYRLGWMPHMYIDGCSLVLTALKLDLSALGIEEESIYPLKVQGEPALRFTWDYFGYHEPREYTVIFKLITEILRTAEYRDWLREVFQKGFDFVLQKAANALPEDYDYPDCYLQVFKNLLKEGGYILSDDLAIHYKEPTDCAWQFPGEGMKGVHVPEAWRKAVEGQRRPLFQGEVNLNGYGWDLNIRQKS